jgi:hypothetical protein
MAANFYLHISAIGKGTGQLGEGPKAARQV